MMIKNSNSLIIWTVITLLIGYAPHALQAPLWLDGFIILLGSYKICTQYFSLPKPGKTVKTCISLVMILIIYFSYSSLRSNQFYILFLLTFVWLKLLEAESIRDFKALILINYYVIFSALLINRELWSFVYLIIAVLSTLSLMVKVTSPHAKFSLFSGKNLSQLLFVLPFSLLLFYIFPRLAQPLWHVPSLAQSTIGLGDSLNTGSISELFSNDTTVMRISFNKPGNIYTYWRYLVLSAYTGNSWQPIVYNPSPYQTLPTLTKSTGYDYEIMLEPTNKKWLFYTEQPQASDQPLIYSSGLGLMQTTGMPVTERFVYALHEQKPVYQPLSSAELRLYTQLPADANPKLRQWALTQYQNSQKKPSEFVAFLEKTINQENFWYTLHPEPMGDDRLQLDRFWFSSRQGFCEHYASAVAFILRSVGIPARIVIGYHGGLWNPFAEFLEIRQNDAHAWLEYWQANQGWIRVDPTAAINPARVDADIRESLSNQTQDLTQLNWDQYKLGLPFWTRTSLYLESLRYFWEKWLLFYNQDTQKQLLSNLGMHTFDPGLLIKFCVGILILFILFFSVYPLLHCSWNKDPVNKEYQRLLTQLKKIGILVTPDKSFTRLMRDLIAIKPELETVIEPCLEDYRKARFMTKDSYEKANTSQVIMILKKVRSCLAYTQ